MLVVIMGMLIFSGALMFSLYIYNIYNIYNIHNIYNICNIYNNYLYISGLAYVGEKDEEGTMFDSMPTALYWAIITMTSVGYGDIYPVSWFGRLVASGQSGIWTAIPPESCYYYYGFKTFRIVVTSCLNKFSTHKTQFFPLVAVCNW